MQWTLTNVDASLAGNETSFANFLARQPSALNSTDYFLNAGIPVAKGTQPILPPLFQLLQNIQDASVGRDGPGDPGNPNSGTQHLLRVLPSLCPVVNPPAC